MVGRELPAGDCESRHNLPGRGILAVGVGYQLTIPADEGNNLGFALFGMRANQDRPEMLLITTCLMSSEKQCIGSIGKNTKNLVIVSEEVEFQ